MLISLKQKNHNDSTNSRINLKKLHFLKQKGPKL